MEIKIRNAVQALEAVTAYLRLQNVPGLPDAGAKWQERRLYSTDIEDYAVTSQLLTFEGWMVEVYQGVAPLSKTVFRIMVFNPDLSWFWQGSVRADGVLSGNSPPNQLSEKEARELAEGISRKLKVPAPRPGTYGH